jgi:hypothetical protein
LANNVLYDRASLREQSKPTLSSSLQKAKPSFFLERRMKQLTPSHQDAVLYNFLGIKQRKNLIFKSAVYRKPYISGLQQKQKFVKCYFNRLEKLAYSPQFTMQLLI